MKTRLFFMLSILAANSLFGAVQAPVPVSAEHQQEENANLATWVREVTQAGNTYVSTLDQGRYTDSWQASSPLFKRMISEKEWVTALELARQRLGRATSRQIKDVRIAWDPKGLPPGPYMVVEYNTAFEKSPNSGETLTFARGSDGRWQVLTYQVN